MFTSLFTFCRFVVCFTCVFALWGIGMWLNQLGMHPDNTTMEFLMFEFLSIVPILCLLLLGFVAGMKKSPPSTPRSHVSCKDLSDYRNRLDRIRRDCRNRMDISKETRHCGAAGYRDEWFVSHGSDYLFAILHPHDYPELNIINKQTTWARKEFHKVCRERGIDPIKGEHHDKPHI